MNKKIIAVDFDGCLFTNEFPNIGQPIEKNIAKLKEEQEHGARAILWTCRVGQKLLDAIEACCAQGIQFDAVNENLPEINEAFGADCRKIFANEYWDDRAVLVDAGNTDEFNDLRKMNFAVYSSLKEAIGSDDLGKLSDGYHTFNELYEQRLYLTAVLFNLKEDLCWKSWRHSDGELCFGGGYFIVGINTPLGQYTYHYEAEHWGLFNLKELDRAPEWDGHTAEDVSRLISLLDKEEPSTRQSWAEREVELACQAERADSESGDDDWDYGCACYESALKAFKSLMSDGHSGFSIQMTKHILVRLLENKPLRPIVDTPDVWSDITEYDPESGYTCYQCNRMSSLFKYVYPDGRVTYTNVDGYICEDVNNHSTYTTGIVARVFEELFPITLPYMPGDPVRFFCEDILTDEKNGDFDTMAIYYAQAPDGTRIDLDRFFKESKDGWAPITKDEWEERLLLAKGLENERKLEEDLAMAESSDDGCQEIGKEEPSIVTAEPVACSYPKDNLNKEVECDVQA